MKGSPHDFFARAAVLEALVEDARLTFSAQDLDEVLDWLAEPARSDLLRALRESGWLACDAAGHHLTDSGRWAYEVLSFLHRRPLELDPDPSQIGRAIMGKSLDELAAAGRGALLPVLAPPPLLMTDAVAREAERRAAVEC